MFAQWDLKSTQPTHNKILENATSYESCCYMSKGAWRNLNSLFTFHSSRITAPLRYRENNLCNPITGPKVTVENSGLVSIPPTRLPIGHHLTRGHDAEQPLGRVHATITRRNRVSRCVLWARLDKGYFCQTSSCLPNLGSTCLF